MILHPALRYVLRTRWRNRLRSWLVKLKTWRGVATALVFGLAAVGILTSGGMDTRLPVEQRETSLAVLLGFMLMMQVFSGLGQRGLIFTQADLDQLFPAPFARRDLLLYHFTGHYIVAILMGLLLAVFLGGRRTPSLAGLALGITLFQVFCAHLHAAAAELSMRLADQVHARLQRWGRLPLAILAALGVLAIVGVVVGMGDVGAALQRFAESPVVGALLHPAEQAVQLGFAPDGVTWFTSLAWVLLYVVASFVVVVVIPSDILESSYAISQKAARLRRQARQGAPIDPQAAGAVRPRRLPSPRLRGARSVLWLNALTLRRQLRALFGGLIMVTMMLLVIGARGGGSGAMLLVLLAMVPLWMGLPIGFRLPREQLLTLQLLPIPTPRLTAALVALPAFVPWALQAIAVLVVWSQGGLEPALIAPVLAAYAATDVTVISIEGMFALRRAHPNQVNIAQSLLQVCLQFVALLPGLIALTVGFGITRSMPWALLAAALVQIVIAGVLLQQLGVRLRAQLSDGAAQLG